MKSFLLLVCLMAPFAMVSAQWELQFCTADTAGVCSGKADLFIWNGAATEVYARLNSKDGLAEGKILFKVLEVQNDLDEMVYAELKAVVRQQARYISKKMYFVKPGYYKVEVYDERMNRLASEYITITDRPE